jgi:hypothetical protein
MRLPCSAGGPDRAPCLRRLAAGRQGLEAGELVFGALLNRRGPEVDGGLHEEDDG